MNEPSNTERYPAEGGRFWLLTDKRNSGEWVRTLRTMGEWANPIGIEVARFNSHVLSMHPELGKAIVDALNAADIEQAIASKRGR